jgi:hypothetical protein
VIKYDIQGQLEMSYDDLEADNLLNDPLSAMDAVTQALNKANAFISDLGAQVIQTGAAVRIS